MGLHAPEWINIILAVITAIYAFLTFRILAANTAVVDEMRKQHEAALRPYVSVSAFVRTGTNMFYLRIKNVGKASATELTLSLDKNFYQLGEKQESRNLANLPAFTNTILSLQPESEMLFLLATGPKLFSGGNSEDVTPLIFTISATYSIGSKMVAEKTVVDLNPYLSTDVPRDDIVEALKELRKSVDNLSNK